MDERKADQWRGGFDPAAMLEFQKLKIGQFVFCGQAMWEVEAHTIGKQETAKLRCHSIVPPVTPGFPFEPSDYAFCEDIGFMKFFPFADRADAEQFLSEVLTGWMSNKK